jgi:hypothetical protein
MSTVHVRGANGELTAEKYVKQIVKMDVMKKMENVGIVYTVIGMIIVIEIVPKIVPIKNAISRMDVAIPVLMVGMVKHAKICVISTVRNVIKRLGHVQYAMMVTGVGSVATHALRIAKHVTN